MKKAKRRLLNLLLAIVVIMGSVPASIGYVVNATEVSSINDGTTVLRNTETSTVEEADAGDEETSYIYQLNITGQVQAGDIYAISFYDTSRGHRDLYLHDVEYQGVDNRVDIIRGNVSDGVLTLVEDTAYSKVRELWEVVDYDSGLALKSKVGNYYLDLDTEDVTRARISTTPVKVKFTCVDAESGLYTIKSEDESKWLSYSNDHRYVCISSGNPQQVNLYKQTTPKLTNTFEYTVNTYVLNTESIQEGDIFVITYPNNGTEREVYFHNNNGNNVIDVFNANVSGEKLTLQSNFSAKRQQWEAVSDGQGGLALKNLEGEFYIDLTQLSSSRTGYATTAKTLTFDETKAAQGLYKIKSGNNALGYNTSSNKFICAAKNSAIDVKLYKLTTETVEAEIVPYEQPSGTTQNQPFIRAETAGSENFRIPCIVTLSTGRIVAAADARWNHDLDGRGIDVVASYSDDGGKTWNYTTPMYFNDSINATTADGNATVILNGATIMDPVMIKDENDKLYVLADIFPGSTAIERALPQYPESSDGHEMIDGTERLVLYTSNQASQQDDNNYAYYVGDFDNDGMAPIV